MSQMEQIEDVIKAIRNNIPHDHSPDTLNIQYSTQGHTAHMAFIVYRQLVHSCINTADTILEHSKHDRYALCIKLLKHIIEQQALLYKLTHSITHHGLEKHIIEPFVRASQSPHIHESIEEMNTTFPGCKDTYDTLLYATITDNHTTLSYHEIYAHLETTLQQLYTISHQFTTALNRLIVLLPSQDTKNTLGQ